ncbi:site-specific integrase [Pseudomonas sp. LA21]|uniref:tyrosine-type recombinase/integrase n=1 Tax=Pseudomonas sp. LA21 TaxID=2893373 RepID=UPI001FB64B0A|nr:site-specific integrase [Pseudomonas sp. LA21]MCJ1888222.1 site-specific integrase [Pseudomonas sp. LA21]
MKNFKLVEKANAGYPSFSLISLPSYEPVFAMEAFCFYLTSTSKKYQTVKSYANKVGKYLDFVVEVVICCVEEGHKRPESYRDILYMFFQAINIIPDGSDPLRDSVVKRLEMRVVKPATDRAYQSAIKHFLSASSSFDEMRSMVERGGFKRSFDVTPIAHRFKPGRFYSDFVRKQIESKDYLSACISGALGSSENLNMPNYSGAFSLGSNTKGLLKIKDVCSILNCTDSLRDKFLFLVLAISGIRLSEALQLLFSDMNLAGATFYVINPFSRPLTYQRMGLTGAEYRKLKFKGRATESVFLIRELEEAFFELYGKFLECPASIPSRDQLGKFVQHEFMFRNGRGDTVGKAMCLNVNYTSTERSFLRSCRRAKIEGVTIHDLRHFWVSHLRNVYRFELEKISKLAGHSNVDVTRRYCHEDGEALREIMGRENLKIYSGGEILVGAYESYK